ncbi:unnamed protein product [Calypogeia fissa]
MASCNRIKAHKWWKFDQVANRNKDLRVCRIVTVFLLVMVSLSFDLSTFELQRIIFSEYIEDSKTLIPQDSSTGQDDSSLKTPPKVQELLDKLRETSRLAADGHDDYILTAKERNAWHKQNPCQSRSELPPMYAVRKYVKDISSNPMWDEVFEEYTNLHRICMKRVGNLSQHFRNKSNVTAQLPGCKFLLAEGMDGLGSKLLVTVSALLYAIVTQRVLLVPSRMTFGTILCEPFVGSSWFLDAKTFPLPVAPKPGAQRRRRNHRNTWEEATFFRQKLQHRLQVLDGQAARQRGNYSDLQSGTLRPPLVDTIVVSATWPLHPSAPEKWFYCHTEQTFLCEVPWMYQSGSLYYIPDLFGSAPFGPTLQALFADRMVITHLLRSALLPSDDVWTRFKQLNHVHFQNVDRRVGIQLRFFDDSHSTMSGVMNYRILDCALTNGILPKLNDTMAEQHSNTSLVSVTPNTTVFIASLHSELHHHLRKYYLQRPTVTGEAVGVVQTTTRQKQRTGTEEDMEALVEMLLLSVSDSLIVTPTSTFGGMGQAYGGLTPWFMRVTSKSDGASCERGQSVDPCEQAGSLLYECLNDPPSPPEHWHGVVGDCLKSDLGGRFPFGIQILDRNSSPEQAQVQL